MVEGKTWKTTDRLPDDYWKWHCTTDSHQKTPRVLGWSFQRTPLESCYSCFSFLSNFSQEYILFSSSRSFFLIEFLKTVTLSCIFSKFLGMFFHNVGPLLEMLYLDLLNLSGSILQLDEEKFVGYLLVGFWNLFWNILVLFEIWFYAERQVYFKY